MCKVFIGHAHLSNCHPKVIKHSMGRFIQWSIIYNTNPQKHTGNTQISFKTTFIINFRHENVDNKMYCVDYAWHSKKELPDDT